MGRSQLYKLTLIGDTGTGKTTTISQLVDGRVPLKERRTIGADFQTKKIEIEGTTVRLQAWDIGGLERFGEVSTNIFYRGSDAFLLFYDETNPKSLEHISNLLTEIEPYFGGLEKPLVILVGNKSDLTAQKKVTLEAVAAMLDIIKNRLLLDDLPTHKLISAIDGTGVQELFTDTAKQLLNKLPPEKNEEPFILPPWPEKKAKDDTSKNAAITTGFFVTLALVVLAIIFWQTIIALSVGILVALAAAAVASVVLSGFGAYKMTEKCTSPENPGSTCGIFSCLNICSKDLGSSHSEEMDFIPTMEGDDILTTAPNYTVPGRPAPRM